MSDLKHPDAVEEAQSLLTTAEQEEGLDIDTSQATIAERVNEYVATRIEPSNAVRYVVEDVLEDEGVPDPSEYTRSATGGRRGGSTDNEQLTVEEIDQSGEWIEFEGTVLETFDTSSEAIAQQGRLADSTGTIRFTIWESDGIETRLERGKSYHLEPVVINEFQDELEIKVANVTEIATLEGDESLGIDPDEYTESISGSIVKFQDQMGLIDRCPNEDCRRVLREEDQCPDCGDVDSEIDLRTKAVLDTGTDSWTIFLDAADTEALTHIDLEEALNIAEEHGDREAVNWAIEQEVHGEYLQVWGRDRGRRFDVEDFELAPSPDIPELEQLRDELQALP